MIKWIRLFPICRSITGDELENLSYFEKLIQNSKELNLKVDLKYLIGLCHQSGT